MGLSWPFGKTTAAFPRGPGTCRQQAFNFNCIVPQKSTANSPDTQRSKAISSLPSSPRLPWNLPGSQEFELVILLHPHPTCRDYSVSSMLNFCGLGIEPRSLCVLTKQSTNCTTFSRQPPEVCGLVNHKLHVVNTQQPRVKILVPTMRSWDTARRDWTKTT